MRKNIQRTKECLLADFNVSIPVEIFNEVCNEPNTARSTARQDRPDR